MAALDDIRVAVMTADGFERKDYEELFNELRGAGATVEILASTLEQMRQGIQSTRSFHPARPIIPDRMIQDASPSEFQALLIVGGAACVDRMRDSRFHLALVRGFADSDRLIGTMSHGAWILADSGMAQGLTLTSAASIRKDLERAGAIWKDVEVAEDRGLISSRGAGDVMAFIRRFMSRLGQYYRVPRRAA